nr:hypothetical protein [Tanacetum cinerariifolium]
MVRWHDTSLGWTPKTYYELCSALQEDRACISCPVTTSLRYILASLSIGSVSLIGVTIVDLFGAFKICQGRSKPMVITKAQTLNGGSRSFLLKALATTFAFSG